MRVSCDTKVLEKLLSKSRGLPNRKCTLDLTTSRIIHFLHRAATPTVSLVDQKNITTFTSSDETVFIAYTAPEDHHLQSTFAALASRNHDKYAFGIATDSNLAKLAGISLPSIVCVKPGEGEQEVLSGQAGIDAMERFIETATAPTIGEFTRRNEMKYMKVPSPDHFPNPSHLDAQKITGRQITRLLLRRHLS